MKKREVYEGWRFPCGGDMFYWGRDGRLIFYEGDNYVVFGRDKENRFVVGGVNCSSNSYKRKKNMKFCPCGKGCKPIRCRIIVENEVRGRRLHED